VKGIDQSKMRLNVSRSDFNLEAYEKMFLEGVNKERLMKAVFYSLDHFKSTLVFCSSVRHAELLAESIKGSAVVSAKTPAKERDQIVEDFKNGTIPMVFNVGVLTTGFDHPELDCIILLRPTRSITLYYQMLGRGVRKAPGKTHCQVIDFSGSVESIGRVETIKLERQNREREWQGKKFMGTRWELISERGSWHNRELYSFRVR
jgi:DNA repair protein RadD